MTSNHLKPSLIVYPTKNKAITPNFACQRFFSTPCETLLLDHHEPIISNRPKDSLGPLILPSGTDTKIFNRPANEFSLTIGSNQSTNDSQDDNGHNDNSGFSLASKSSFLRKSGIRNKTHQPMVIPSTSLLKKSGTSKDLFGQFGALIPDQSVSAKLKPTARKLDYDSSGDEAENAKMPNNNHDDALNSLIPTKSMSFPESKLFQIQGPDDPFSEYKASLFSQIDNRTRFQRDYITHDDVETTSSIAIYKCRHAHDGQDYIIKCLDEDLANENRLYDSCRLLNQLQGHNRTDSLEEGGNENLVRYYNAWREDGKLYIVLEFCNGGNLIQIMQRNQGQSEAEIIKIITDISAALCPLHQQNLIHGHIKPENILLSRSGKYKLSDVELANLSYNIKIHRHVADKNILENARQYFSPENEENNQEKSNSSSIKSDVFSLGLVISQLMLGSDLRNNTETLKELKNGSFNKIEQLPAYSIKLKETVKRMLSRDPNDRPSAKELFEQYGPKTPRKVLVLEREHNSEIKGDIAKLRAQLVLKRKKSF